GEGSPVRVRRPLLITSDEDLLDELLRLAAAAGTELEVATDPTAARGHYRVAPLVLLAADQARPCLRARLPPRGYVALVAPAARGGRRRAGPVGRRRAARRRLRRLPARRRAVAGRPARRLPGPASTRTGGGGAGWPGRGRRQRAGGRAGRDRGHLWSPRLAGGR